MDPRTLERMLDGTSTNDVGDRLIHAELLKLTRPDPETHAQVQREIMRRRRGWLTWVTTTQSKWGVKGTGVHHDSFELREKYVAPHVDYGSEREFMMAARKYNATRRPDLFEGRQ